MQMLYQLIDQQLYTRGIFDDYDKATTAATSLHIEHGGVFQVNRIPLNTIGHYGECFDVAWSIGTDQKSSHKRHRESG